MFVSATPPSSSRQQTYHLLSLNSKYLPAKKCYYCGLSYKGLHKQHTQSCESVVYWCECCDITYLKEDEQYHKRNCNYIQCYCCRTPVRRMWIVDHLLECNSNLASVATEMRSHRKGKGRRINQVRSDRKRIRDKENRGSPRRHMYCSVGQNK